jgi:hypothetical protein
MNVPHHNPDPTVRHASGLRDDNRGAVMVVGVFMAAFLVGSLWYVIGIGDAVLYRERMQDGADAAAYAAAVYHARGMNMIAMLNIIMAAILAVLVAFKLLQLINWIANAVSCALWWTGVGAAVCSLTSSLEAPIANAVSIAEKLVNTALPILSKTEVGIAVAMPWVAEAKSVYVASEQYKKPVEGGGTISVSLIPFVDGRLGLPVQEDDYEFLCKKAGQYVGKLVFSPFGGFGNWVAGVVGDIVSTFPGFFCGDSGGGFSGGSGSPVTDSTIDDLVKKGCDEKKDKLPKSKQKDFDMDKCMEEGKKDVQKELKKLGSKTGGSSSIDSSGKTSKRVYDDAQNGDGYFQIWSIVVGDDEWPKKAEKGVQIAAWSKGSSMPQIPWGKVGFAQAEFYYDAPGAWDDMKEDAMWNMRWRARLRRVHVPEGTVANILSGLNGILGGKLASSITGVLGDPTIAAFIFGSGSQSDFLDDVKAVTSGGSAWGGSLVQDPMLKDTGGMDIIH